MRNLVLFILITFLMFSCTIEKRRYFKGYHVENGILRQAQGPGKWGNGEERKWESEEEIRSVPLNGSGTTQEQHSGSSEAVALSDIEKPHLCDIVIDGEIAMASGNIIPDNNIVSDYLSNEADGLTVVDVLKADEKSIPPKQQNITIQNNQSQEGAANGNAIIDVGRVIFGMLSIVSFALALLFFGSAIFAIDSLVMTVLLLIGGGFALAGLVFLVVYALIKRKQSVSGLMSGSVNHVSPDEKEPKSILGMVLAFLITGSISAYLLFLMSISLESFIVWFLYFSFFSITCVLAIVFAFLAVVRWKRRNRYLRMKSANPPRDFKE